jgi:ATP-dependent helicase HrpB
VEGVRRHGLALLPWGEAAIALRQRVAFAAPFLGDLPGMDDSALIEALDEWLPALVAGRRRLDAIPPAALDQALRDRIGWEGLRRLDRIAPPSFQAPAGSGHPIDYGAEGGPAIEVRPQALFGLATHPMVGDGRVPLVLRLVSPAGRIIQTTRDLPGFWAGSWADVARAMRGRYPRHPWPDDPAAADATLRTKRADARARS